MGFNSGFKGLRAVKLWIVLVTAGHHQVIAPPKRNILFCGSLKFN